MKRFVKGRNGFIVTYGEHPPDEELKEQADQLIDSAKSSIFQQVNKDLSGYSIERMSDNDAAVSDSRIDALDSLGLDIARAYAVEYERVEVPAIGAIAIFTFSGRRYQVNTSLDRQSQRGALTGNLKSHGFRPRDFGV